MKYEIREHGKCMRGWDSAKCMPEVSQLKSMYEAGLRMYVDGKALKLADATRVVEAENGK